MSYPDLESGSGQNGPDPKHWQQHIIKLKISVEDQSILIGFRSALDDFTRYGYWTRILYNKTKPIILILYLRSENQFRILDPDSALGFYQIRILRILLAKRIRSSPDHTPDPATARPPAPQHCRKLYN